MQISNQYKRRSQQNFSKQFRFFSQMTQSIMLRRCWTCLSTNIWVNPIQLCCDSGINSRYPGLGTFSSPGDNSNLHPVVVCVVIRDQGTTAVTLTCALVVVVSCAQHGRSYHGGIIICVWLNTLCISPGMNSHLQRKRFFRLDPFFNLFTFCNMSLCTGLGGFQ